MATLKFFNLFKIYLIKYFIKIYLYLGYWNFINFDKKINDAIFKDRDRVHSFVIQ